MEYQRAEDAEDVMETRHPSQVVKKGVFAVLTLGFVGLMGFLGGQHYLPKQSQPNDQVVGKWLPNLTEFAVVLHTTECYGFTGGEHGGICTPKAPCEPWRNASCMWVVNDTNDDEAVGSCSCPNGCSTINGTCGPAKNKKKAWHFTLSNSYWPTYKMYIPRLDMTMPVSVSNWPDSTFDNSQYFSLYEFNGDVNGLKKYFLASDKWPSWVAALGHSLANIYGAFAYNLDNPVVHWPPEGIVVDVCDMTGKGRPGEVKIGAGNKWFYLTRTSWKVAATTSSDDPGVTGYWKPEPPIKGLQACD